MKPWALPILATSLLACSESFAQPGADLAFTWCQVGDAGNRPTSAAEMPAQPDLQIGSVPYNFSITQTEVTVRQWFGFVQAYAPYYDGPANRGELTGGWIDYRPGVGYSYAPEVADWPVMTTWHMAARYVNWLQNGRGTSRAAFESGAYDTSTFHMNPDGSRSDQLAHSPGAQYWLPTEDEWVKATYFDPNRYGEGQGGYWLFPNKSDLPPIPGIPGTGATTNAGYNEVGMMAAGLYPNAASPWGLLDTSGGLSEWLETATDALQRPRYLRGSPYQSDLYSLLDRVDNSGVVTVNPQIYAGFRVVYAVPAPGTVLVAIGAIIIFRRNR